MKLREYLELKKIKANVWAKENGLPVSGVYAWLAGTMPTIKNILQVKTATGGAVGPEDWVNGNGKK